VVLLVTQVLEMLGRMMICTLRLVDCSVRRSLDLDKKCLTFFCFIHLLGGLVLDRVCVLVSWDELSKLCVGYEFFGLLILAV